ncbi:hypothetical protein LTR15_001814 [Elasticomyces elasticus]|nr:hypothetical protein LTR15_001814 [Elasticomyces elasticus]
MATRRSTRLSGGTLSNEVTQIEAQARNQALTEQRASREAKYADIRCKFHLFDLVPELREQTFYYAMELEEPRQIATLKLPTVLDSMGLSQENSQPLYGGPRARLTAENSYTRSGRITAFDSYGPNSRSLLARLKKREGFVACFRNIEMRFSGVSARRLQVWAILDKNQLSLRIPTASKPRPTIECAVATMASVYQAELDMLRERAVDQAREIAGSRERFVGFTLQDLEEVVAEFAYWPD